MAEADAKKRAVIVGSGVAGVTAAHALLQIDWDVTVLQSDQVNALYSPGLARSASSS